MIYMFLSNRDINSSICLVEVEISLTSAKSVNPDEMQHYTAFRLGLEFLQK